MKSNFAKVLSILLITAFLLCACGADNSPSGIVKKELTSGPWLADMSEGTTATYTFAKDGTFTCDAVMTVGEQSASLTREGNYEIKEAGDAVTVYLLYPNVTYFVEITCTENNGSYDFVIAGCPMYQK